MKLRRILVTAGPMGIALLIGYMIGYQRGNSARFARTSTLTSLRQVGLNSRTFRNDIGNFRTVSDPIVTGSNASSGK
jgi:hypothetical protein